MRTLDELLEQGVISRGVPLGPMTTYKSGGPARLMAEVPDRATLQEIVSTGATREIPLLILGRGSNLLVADEGFPGLVVRLGEEFNRIDIEGTTVVAGPAVPLPKLARTTVEAGLRGLEFFVGVPGSVGGAVRQNAGCFGSETKDRLSSVDLIDLRTGDTRTVPVADLDLGYRHSNVRSQDLVASARFATERGDAEQGRDIIRRVTRWRRDNQPGGTLNAGSVFKNPPGISAGELIDNCGLKGLSVGDVSVSTKHANFFVAGGGATSRDIYRLVEEVKDRVFASTGTMLEPEIQLVGFDQ